MRTRVRISRSHQKEGRHAILALRRQGEESPTAKLTSQSWNWILLNRVERNQGRHQHQSQASTPTHNVLFIKDLPKKMEFRAWERTWATEGCSEQCKQTPATVGRRQTAVLEKSSVDYPLLGTLTAAAVLEDQVTGRRTLLRGGRH